MLKITITIILIITSVFTFSQKKDNFSCGNFNYELPPADTALIKYKGYILNLNFPPLSFLTTKRMARRNFKLSEFEQFSDLNTESFIVDFIFSDVSFTQEKENKKKSTKVIDGVKTVVYLYKYTSEFTYNYSVKISAKFNEIYYEKFELIEGKISGKSNQNKEKALLSIKEKMSNNSMKSSFSKTIQNESILIQNNFCYTAKKMSLMMYKVKGKKYNYDIYNSYVDSIKVIVEKSNWHSFLEDSDRMLMLEMIENYNKELKTGEPDNKKARFNSKTMAQTFYNIGLVYFLLEDYPQAIYHMKQANAYFPKFFTFALHKANAMSLFYERQQFMREL